MGPKWCKWIGAMLSGLCASLFFLSLISLFTVLHLYNLLCFQFFLLVLEYFFCFFFWVCGVYCWLNLLVHLLGSLWRLVFWAPNYLALFAGCLLSIDKKSFRCAQSLDQLLLWVSVCTSLIQFLHLCPWTLFFTSRFSCYFWWPWRFFLNFISFSENFTASLGKFATTFYLFLVRYDCQPLRYGFR